MIMLNACVGVCCPSMQETWTPVACQRGEGRLRGGVEEVTEWYQLTLPCNPNSNRLKCYEHVCTGMPLSVHACMSNMVHMEEGFGLNYCEWSNYRVQCCLPSMHVKCSSLHGPKRAQRL